MKNEKNELVKCKKIEKGNPFTIHTIEWDEQNSHHKNDTANSNDHFQIIWITKGSGDLWIDLEEYQFQNDQIFFVKPFQVFRFRPADKIEGYIISFTNSFLGIDDQGSDPTYHSSLFRMFAGINAIQITGELFSEIKDLAEKMIVEYNKPHLFRNEMLARYLKILFIYLFRHCESILQTTRQTRDAELTQQFIALLDKHFKAQKMVSGYAGMLLVTPNYLNEIIKKTTGYSAGYHIRQRVVLEAKRQATYSNSCMKQIGYYLGFNDMAHFSKFFKTAAGINFSDYKKEKMVISIAS